MIGKTIAQVVDLDYLGQALIFTDGTAVELHPIGHEADGVQFEDCMELDVFHEAALQENFRRDLVVRNAESRRRYAAGEMRGMELVIYEMMLDTVKSMQSAMSRQVFGSQALIPIFKHEGDA